MSNGAYSTGVQFFHITEPSLCKFILFSEGVVLINYNLYEQFFGGGGL